MARPASEVKTMVSSVPWALALENTGSVRSWGRLFGNHRLENLFTWRKVHICTTWTQAGCPSMGPLLLKTLKTLSSRFLLMCFRSPLPPNRSYRCMQVEIRIFHKLKKRTSAKEKAYKTSFSSWPTRSVSVPARGGCEDGLRETIST